MKKKNDKTIRKRLNCLRVKKSKKGVQKGGTIIGKRTLQKHQIRVGEKIKSFMNNREGSPNGILLFHGAGTGKTISSLWCVLNIFYDFDKRSKREGIEKRVILIGPTEALLTQFGEELGNLKEVSDDSLNNERVNNDIVDNIIETIQRDLIYFSFEKLLELINDKDNPVAGGKFISDESKESKESKTWNQLNKRDIILVIDEAHYLRKDDNSIKFYNGLLSHESFKILLTATPFVDNISDIGFYNNIIKGTQDNSVDGLKILPYEYSYFLSIYGKKSFSRNVIKSWKNFF